MKRKALTILVTIIATCIISFSAHAVGLKENSIITDDTIKLGDLFYGLSRDEDRPLGAAPRPGDEMIINARTLLRIAVALDISWRPQDAQTRAIIKREATVIKQDQITKTLISALKKEGAYGNFEVTVGNLQDIILPIDEPAKLDITRINYDQGRNKFTATIAAPSAENPIQNLSVQGYLHPVIDVPVLRDNQEHGRRISTHDIEIIQIREGSFSKDTIASIDQLIGMTPRRLITAGRPIKRTDIIAPVIVERGELITLSLANGAMNITTQVKALENGAKGDVIRVVNLSSNKTIQALVTSTSEVSIIQ